MAIKEENIRIRVTVSRELNEKIKLKAKEKKYTSLSKYVYSLIMKDLEK